MIGIFLDDERNPEDVTWIDYPNDIEWYVVRRMNDFLVAVFNMTGEYFISFDHDLAEFDLAGDENTGYKALKAMVDYHIQKEYTLPKCYFHTQNPIGKKNMEMYYQNALKHIKPL